MRPEGGAAREGCGIQMTPERGAVYKWHQRGVLYTDDTRKGCGQRGVRYTDHFREGCDIQITPERGAVYR